jgi:hypothetical protein
VAACAYVLGARLTMGAMLGSAVPFEVVPERRGLNGMDRVLLVLSRWAPPLARAALHAAVAWPTPERLRTGMLRQLPGPDAAVLRASAAPDAVAFVKESVRSGTRGVIQEYRVFGAPWGFELGEVRVPIQLWEGSEDHMGPPSYPAALLAGLANATLETVPGEGHLSLLVHCADRILAPFVDAAG